MIQNSCFGAFQPKSMICVILQSIQCILLKLNYFLETIIKFQLVYIFIRYLMCYYVLYMSMMSGRGEGIYNLMVIQYT